MMNHRRFYFGLSTTFHDPALALVNSDGEVIFAEAAERCLKYKRAYGLVHINRTGRLQSVRREWNKLYYELIYSFYKLTGVPMLLNTSFNIMGKPIMHSVEDAVGLFYTTGLDALVIEDYLTVK
jgi:predicted NodU family carbamoyl transferase